MKKILLVLFFIFVFSSNLFAIQIICQDEYGSSYKKGKLTNDSHRYLAKYTLDIENQKLIQTYLADTKANYIDERHYEYTLLSKPKLKGVWDSQQIKAIKYNKLTGGVATIVFSKGSYIYSELMDNYINIFEGTYKYTD